MNQIKDALINSKIIQMAIAEYYIFQSLHETEQELRVFIQRFLKPYTAALPAYFLLPQAADEFLSKFNNILALPLAGIC